jgi:hypothetical protein
MITPMTVAEIYQEAKNVLPKNILRRISRIPDKRPLEK